MMKSPIDIPRLSGFRPADAAVLFFVVSFASMVVYVAGGWEESMQTRVTISLNPVNLPGYCANSLVRIFFAYLLSLSFSIWYGYTANRSALHEKIMIPLLDILQSIPVLSFLPGFVMAMISIFPHRRAGVELAAILLIFTGQVWNMAFSYYLSVKTMPRELSEVAGMYGMGRFARFTTLDLPFGAIGLVWNSMMSVAGGWFFLMACEMFTLGDRDFRLPGLGSYIQTAAAGGDIRHVLYGLASLTLLVVLLDVFIWRPLVAWTQKFRFDTAAHGEEAESAVLDVLRKSNLAQHFGAGVKNVFGVLEKRFAAPEAAPARGAKAFFIKASNALAAAAAAAAAVWALYHGAMLISGLSLDLWLKVFKGGFYSLLRTSLALLLAAVWTVPLGVYIGLNPKAAKFLQPLVQIAASIPATAAFPVILLLLLKLGGGLGGGSIFLMLLGTQWYLLFNVIAGASAIPKHLIDIADLYCVRGVMRWKTLILPGIFGYFITGLITATGGAWNATIVSEYVTFGGTTYQTPGLGSIINESTASGNFGLLLLATLTMAAIVVAMNRLVWKKLYVIAQEKYRLE